MGGSCWLLSLFLLLVATIGLTRGIDDRVDKPCAARQMVEGQSVVCVCNDTYCDETYRDEPEEGQFTIYTTSKAGKRFYKSTGTLESRQPNKRNETLNLVLDPSVTYQEILGFGSAATDAATINWRSLSKTLQQSFINSYFSDKGIEYNIIRVPIGASDFSTYPYAYNELPLNDKSLCNFTLSKEDYYMKIPFIKHAKKAASDEVYVLGTTWSPPKWMKSNNKWDGYSVLLPKYYKTYANYHYKFVEEYDKNNVKVWGLTTTNEPINGIVTLVPYFKNITCLGWLSEDMNKWIVKYLGPKFRKSKYKDIKILAMDDQRYSLPNWFDPMVKANKEVLKYIDGVAIHYYANSITPTKLLLDFRENYPDLFLLNTEACEGAALTETVKVLFGSWSRAVGYITNILTDLNNYLVGWMDWNIMLNKQGGPSFISNFVDSPAIALPEDGEFVKQPMFYAMGHFSKFLPRGSIRIEVMRKKPLAMGNVTEVAFITPRNTIAVVLYNEGVSRSVALKLNNITARLILDEDSITTIEIPYKPT